MTITDLLKDRLVKNRAMTTITLRIPGDVVELAKTIAAQRNFVGYEALFKAYISAGPRRDDANLGSQLKVLVNGWLMKLCRGQINA